MSGIQKQPTPATPSWPVSSIVTFIPPRQMISSTLFSLASLVSTALVGADCTGINAISPRCPSHESLHRRDFFYVGGHYVAGAAGNLTYDQLYVEKLTPVTGVRRSKPVVLFHGGGTSGVVSRV